MAQADWPIRGKKADLARVMKLSFRGDCLRWGVEAGQGLDGEAEAESTSAAH